MLMGLPGAMAAMGKKAYMGLGNLLEKKIIEASRPKYGMDELYPGELSGLKPVSTEGNPEFIPFVNTERGYEPRLPGIAGDAYNAFIASRRSMTDPNFNAEEEGVNMGLNLMGMGTAFGRVPEGALAMAAGKRMSREEAERLGYWHPIGTTKLAKPIGEFSRATTELGNVANAIDISPELLTGKTLIPAIGDRTDAGRMLTKIGDTEIPPLELQGGHGYMRTPGKVWASGQGMVTKLNKKINQALKKESEPLLIYMPTGHKATNSSSMLTDNVFDQIQSRNIPNSIIKEFDKELKSKRPEWLGLGNMKARDQLAKNMALKNAFLGKAKLKKYLKEGFPDINESRFAVTDPDLLDTKILYGGQAIASPTGKNIESPEILHRSYPVQMEGNYVGRIGDPKMGIPPELLFPKFYEERRIQGKPFSADYRSFDLSKPLQKIDNQWVDNIMKYLESNYK
jgi:hypothetical protein